MAKKHLKLYKQLRCITNLSSNKNGRFMLEKFISFYSFLLLQPLWLCNIKLTNSGHLKTSRQHHCVKLRECTSKIIASEYNSNTGKSLKLFSSVVLGRDSVINGLVHWKVPDDLVFWSVVSIKQGLGINCRLWTTLVKTVLIASG